MSKRDMNRLKMLETKKNYRKLNPQEKNTMHKLQCKLEADEKMDFRYS